MINFVMYFLTIKETKKTHTKHEQCVCVNGEGEGAPGPGGPRSLGETLKDALGGARPGSCPSGGCFPTGAGRRSLPPHGGPRSTPGKAEFVAVCSMHRQTAGHPKLSQSWPTDLSSGKARGEGMQAVWRGLPGRAAAQLPSTINQSSLSEPAPPGGALTFHPDP